MCVALLALPVQADGDPVADLIGRALAGDEAYTRLAWLTDRIGHRLPGSENLERAVDWAVEEFRKDGLAGISKEEVEVPHWVRGHESAEIVSPARHDIALSALGGSVATPEGGLTAEAIVVRDFDELQARAGEVAGKIVVYDKPIRRNGGREHGYGSAAGLRVRGAVEAARHGAVATLVRSLGTADYRLPHTGMMRYEEGVPKIPSAAIAAEDAELIARLAASGAAVRIRLELGCRTLPDAISHNVIADLPGRENPEEIVVLACHLDSWDVGTGAIDDGAGCVIVMEAVRLLTTLERPPRRTVRVVLYTSEENGAWGGRQYAEVHAGELDRHVAAIESDAGAGVPEGFGVSGGPGAVEIVRKLAAPLARIGAADVRDGGGGADISPMKPAGVPQMNLRQDTTFYFDYHHSAADTLDKVDPSALAKNVAAMAVMAWGLADHPGTLPRIPPPKPVGIDEESSR
jgi:hypothetical protein